MKKRIAIIGASGYTGREVRRLVESHPDMQADVVTAGRPDVEPTPPKLSFDPIVAPLDLDQFQYVDGVFLCTPHGASAEIAQPALDAGCAVVDMSADFRLRDPEVYKTTYGRVHRAPQLLEEAVYGLTEHFRRAVAGARLVANPGCYPTAVALPLLPLLRSDLLDLSADIIADCKSGVSGAGRQPQTRTHFGSVHENFSAYEVGTHRHTPEIHQVTGTDRVVFVPHLLPVFRGILATIYVRPKQGVRSGDVLGCLDEAYGAEPFVRVYDRGLPELDRVQRTNFCDIAVAQAGERTVLVAAIDNLVKGAAGQAVQNMNLMLGLDEGAGLA